VEKIRAKSGEQLAIREGESSRIGPMLIVRYKTAGNKSQAQKTLMTARNGGGKGILRSISW